ncbi:hypothetical protein BH160DRAFT_5072 [Burkholderia sp. H160]|nr:hypothetical protein BH160DRAFT_5072 [Burkholderia sp. H160]
MTDERRIGQAMIEVVLSGRNGSASEASAVRQAVALTVQCTMLIGRACEVPA